MFSDERNPIYQLVMEFADMGTLEKYIQDNCGLLGVPSFKQILQGVAVGIANVSFAVMSAVAVVLQ